MIQATKTCEHVYRVGRTINSRDGTRRTQYRYCVKCGKSRKNIITIPATEFRIHFWVRAITS